MLGESNVEYSSPKSQTEEQRYGGVSKPSSNVVGKAPKIRYEGMGFNNPDSKRINPSTKSSDSESSEEKKVVQSRKQIITPNEKVIKVREGNTESFISDNSDTNRISLILKDEYFDKAQENKSVVASDLIKDNVKTSESALTRFCRKFITFESHQSGKKVAFYTIPQVMVWVNALLVKVFVVIIPFVTGTAITLAVSASIFTGIAAGGIALGILMLVLSAKNDEGKRLITLPFFNKQIPARRTAVIVAALAFLGTSVAIGATLGLMAGLTAGGALLGGIGLLIFLKKTIFAPTELKEKFLHINKLPLDDKDPEKLAKYKSALRWARIPLLVHSLLFNVKALRGQFIGQSQCPNDPQTFTTTGVVVIPDEIAAKIVGNPERGSIKTWMSRHCPFFSTLATMRFINFAMTALVLSSLVCTILVIAGVSIGPLSALAIPMALEAMGGSAAGISAFLLANHWASIAFFSLILACYLPTLYRTIRDNKFERELSDLRPIKDAYSPLNQEWLQNNGGTKVRSQILTRKKILATIYFELTKKRIDEKSLENLSASELKAMINFEYSNQIRSNQEQTKNMNQNELTKKLIELRAKALKDTFHSFQYLKQEGLAQLMYETEYNRKIASINESLENLDPQAKLPELIKNIPEVNEIFPDGYKVRRIILVLEDADLSFPDKIQKIKEIIKVEAGYIVNEKTQERVDRMRGSFMGESTLKEKEKKAQAEFDTLIEEIKKLPEYDLGEFKKSLQYLSEEELREKLNDELGNQPHANESDVIARFSLHRATAWYLSENGGWNNRRNNAADIKENTLQKIVKTLVSECNQLDSGTLDYEIQAIKAKNEAAEQQYIREQKRKNEADKSKFMEYRNSSQASQMSQSSKITKKSRL